MLDSGGLKLKTIEIKVGSGYEAEFLPKIT